MDLYKAVRFLTSTKRRTMNERDGCNL